jgi:6,7-dimethyl-8-ribityllumazine synthase
LSGHRVTVVRVPGAFEIPLAVQRLARKRVDAVIALGVIWQGGTDHADLIARECARACMEIALREDVPVIFEVLTVRTEAQARARCLGRKLNRGAEAARTALEMGALK